MTVTERRYRARVCALVQASIDAGGSRQSLARACFPRKDHTAKSTATAWRKIEREMGTDPSDRTSEGVKWGTIESLATGLGCSVMHLFSWSKVPAGASVKPDGSIVFRSEADLIAWAEEYNREHDED